MILCLIEYNEMIVKKVAELSTTFREFCFIYQNKFYRSSKNYLKSKMNLSAHVDKLPKKKDMLTKKKNRISKRLNHFIIP